MSRCPRLRDDGWDCEGFPRSSSPTLGCNGPRFGQDQKGRLSRRSKSFLQNSLRGTQLPLTPVVRRKGYLSGTGGRGRSQDYVLSAGRLVFQSGYGSHPLAFMVLSGDVASLASASAGWCGPCPGAEPLRAPQWLAPNASWCPSGKCVWEVEPHTDGSS